MAVAGHSVTLERTEAAAQTLTTEATTLSVGNTVAQITSTSKHVLDPDTAVTVLDNGVAATNVRVDYLFGRIIKTTGAFTGPVTVSGKYLERFAAVEPRSFSAKCSTDLPDTTLLGDQDRARSVSGLRTAEGDFAVLESGDNDDADNSLQVELSSGHRWVLSCDFGGGVIFRALVKLSSLDRSAAYDGLFELTAQWQAAFSRGTGQTLGSNSFGWSDLSG